MTSETDQPRFEFGKNWRSFLDTIDDVRIESAIASLRTMLGCDDLAGTQLLDLGCGSGLFSLAAWRLGADVTSIDYDPQCVACAEELRRRYDDQQNRWHIERGSALDESLMNGLGEFDVVYSWGVLHHTGDMWTAIDLASQRVAVGGRFFISIYNDQGTGSRRWLKTKQTYASLPAWSRPIMVGAIATFYETKYAAVRLAKLQNPSPIADWKSKKSGRGMSVWHDWIDWVGGLPFEVATPEKIQLFLKDRGFTMQKLETVGKGWGCNQFVFQRGDAE